MCGIAGFVNMSGEVTPRLLEALKHRGPDTQSSVSFENITLGHTRLAIQDVLHAHQPMNFEEYTLVFNGEIYNHLELRSKVSEFSFKTHSDTETLLYLLITYKEKALEMLDGMFAFALLNKKTKQLFLGRDRAGKKPLYYFHKDNQFLFASELNALKSAIPSLEVNDETIASYIRSGFLYKDKTPYKAVYEVDAGSLYCIDTDSLKIEKQKYFEILDYYKQPEQLSFDEAKEKLDLLLHKSVKNRLLSSDLEVGAFLSGGIDSSLIVAIASEYVEDLKTFTVKFEGGFDESGLARLTAQKYQTSHHEIEISMNVKDDVEKILCNYGEPFMDSSAIPSYYVSQEAKKHVTVILNGDGADELFGGYRRYVPVANEWVKKASYLSSLTKVLPKPHNKKSLYNYGYRLLSMSSKTGADFYLSATNDIFEDAYGFEPNAVVSEMDSFIQQVEKENISELSKMLYMDFNLILQSDLLKKMDIATMAHSLEGRSPFLSKYMLEFAPTLADSYKIRGKSTKHILRELSKKYLSKELITQPKRGFEIPLKSWVENDLKENIFDRLGSNCYSQNFVDKEFINKLLAKKISVSDEKRAKMLWTLYSLEIWKGRQ